MKDVIIGIDFGGTHLRIGAVTPENEMKKPSVIKSIVIAAAANPVSTLCNIIESYISENKIQSVSAISIGVPSSVANDKETVICTTNIRNSTGQAVFANRNIAKEIKEYLGLPVFVNNDVNNILLYDVAEHRLEQNKIVVGIYIGTGVGSSVIIEGKSLEGKDGAELDLGHIPYFRGEEPCSCGKMGCCECYSSGWRLQQIRSQYYPDTFIGDLFTKHKDEPPMLEFIDACAYVYAIMATIFNPDSIVVGGGIAEMEDFPRELFEGAVNEKTGRDVMNYGFKYVYSETFVGKGVIGAAVFARKKMQEGS